MTKEELMHLISLGEGQTIEFKRSLSEDFGREIVAFANTLGGTLLVGVDDEGRIVGVEHANRMKARIQNTAGNLEPPVRVLVETIDSVIAVTVPQSPDRPHSSGGRFYIREGATCQQMGRSRIREFFFREGLLFFDAMPSTEFELKKDLVSARYRAFARSAGISPKLEMMHALTNLRLVTHNAMTNAGALFLCDRASRFIFSATISCALFQGTGKARILDQKKFDAAIPSMYADTLNYLQSHLNTEYIIAAGRTERLELPEAALREAIINAIAHRDYRNPANIQVYIFFDRIEIHNPGGLVPGLKLSDLGKRSAPRNPLLFSILYRMDFVEHVGSGINRIKDAMAEYGLPEPVIEADENWFAVTLKRKGGEKSGDGGINGGINGGIETLFNCIVKHPGNRASFYQKQLSPLSKRSLERWIAELKRQGRIEFRGSKKTGGYYSKGKA